MKNKKILIIASSVLIIIIFISVYLLFNKNTYRAEVRLVDSELNPSRKIVILHNNKEIKDIKLLKTTDGYIIDETYPFTINHTSVDELNGKVVVVLKNGKEITVKIKK